MTYSFRPASSFTERHGLFVAVTGGTNSGKTVSGLRLAKGIAGPNGKVAVLDTEGGRTLHLKSQFDFDANVMDPPFRPQRFAEAAKAAEDAGYDVLLIDSFSMEWVGIGGVLDWQEAEITRMAGDDWKKRERVKMASWIKPKGAHKAMVYSFLQRRMPIIFSIRGEETVKPGENPGDKPTTVFKTICNAAFPFEVTVSFRLRSEAKGIIDLSDPKGWKMEGDHRAIFRDGDQLSEQHGAALAAWAKGEGAAMLRPAVPVEPLAAEPKPEPLPIIGPDRVTLHQAPPGKWLASVTKALGAQRNTEEAAAWAAAMEPHLRAMFAAGHQDLVADAREAVLLRQSALVDA
jgi:hypothetical protein